MQWANAGFRIVISYFLSVFIEIDDNICSPLANGEWSRNKTNLSHNPSAYVVNNIAKASKTTVGYWKAFWQSAGRKLITSRIVSRLVISYIKQFIFIAIVFLIVSV